MSFVYVIGPDDPSMDLPTPPIKIGKAIDLANRLRTLQTGSPQRLVLYAFYDFGSPHAASAVESACHRNFKSSRGVGEWFGTTCEQVDQFIRLRMAKRYPFSIRIYQPHH